MAYKTEEQVNKPALNYNASDPKQVAAARTSIRDSILTTKPKSKVIAVFGTEVEIRQPSLRVILENQTVTDEERASTAARMLIKYAFVPGTTERIFEDVDVDGILGLPFGEDMQLVQDTINELMGIQGMVQTEKGNLPTT